MPTLPSLDLKRPGLKYLPIADPGAGNNLNINWAIAEYRFLVGLHFLLTADANVANRFMRLTFDDGVDIITTCGQNNAQTAALAVTYSFAINLTAVPHSALDLRAQIALPDGLILPIGSTIQTAITNIQAGDAITGAYALFHYWLIAP